VSDPIGAVLPTVARALEARASAKGGLDRLGEVKDLEPEMVTALSASSSLIVEKARKIAVPGWSPVGNVDVVCRRSPYEPPTHGIELKWSKGDKIYEGLWDLFKMALLATSPGVEATYLVTGASRHEWQRAVGRELFTACTHGVLDLCELKFTKRRAWDYLLQGGYDRFPERVPARIETILVGTSPIGEDWELRAVRVLPSDDEFVPFIEGWPNGVRPVDAKHPLVAQSDRA
jgi:hypothetical protein